MGILFESQEVCVVDDTVTCPNPLSWVVIALPHLCQCWLPVAHTCLFCQRIIFSRHKTPAWKYLEGYALPHSTWRQPEAGWWLVSTGYKSLASFPQAEQPSSAIHILKLPTGSGWGPTSASLSLPCFSPSLFSWELSGENESPVPELPFQAQFPGNPT